MNQRLIWNFELLPKKPISLPSEALQAENLKWEIRYFWPENTIIKLYAIEHNLYNITQYKQKYKEDTYFLLPEQNYNIKERRKALLYKPLLNQTRQARAFGSKILLESTDEPGLQAILNQVLQRGIAIFVQKSSFTYTFTTLPKIKLELAKLVVKDRIFFSACIEGKSQPLVEKINALLLDKQKACDYISFLKNIIKL